MGLGIRPHPDYLRRQECLRHRSLALPLQTCLAPGSEGWGGSTPSAAPWVSGCECPLPSSLFPSMHPAAPGDAPGAGGGGGGNCGRQCAYCRGLAGPTSEPTQHRSPLGASYRHAPAWAWLLPDDRICPTSVAHTQIWHLKGWVGRLCVPIHV